MKSKWIKILLIASLALNLAFLSTLAYRRLIALKHFHHDKEINSPMAQIIENDLELKKDQKEEIRKIIKEFELKLMDYKQQILDQRIDIVETMGDPDFNLQDLELKTSELNKLENQLNLTFVDALTRINTLLEPQQRMNFLYKLSKQWFFLPKRTPGEEMKKEMGKEMKNGGEHD
jgi:Spy/CpxP family protein refolding chaperone